MNALQYEIAKGQTFQPVGRRNRLFMMVGLPRSGKSTLALTAGVPIVSPDSIRLALHGAAFVTMVEPLVWHTAKLMVAALFLSGHKEVILDATNVSRDRREEWKDERWDRIFVCLDTDFETCVKRVEQDILDVRADGGLLDAVVRMNRSMEVPGVRPAGVEESDWQPEEAEILYISEKKPSRDVGTTENANLESVRTLVEFTVVEGNTSGVNIATKKAENLVEFMGTPHLLDNVRAFEVGDVRYVFVLAHLPSLSPEEEREYVRLVGAAPDTRDGKVRKVWMLRSEGRLRNLDVRSFARRYTIVFRGRDKYTYNAFGTDLDSILYQAGINWEQIAWFVSDLRPEAQYAFSWKHFENPVRENWREDPDCLVYAEITGTNPELESDPAGGFLASVLIRFDLAPSAAPRKSKIRAFRVFDNDWRAVDGSGSSLLDAFPDLVAQDVRCFFRMDKHPERIYVFEGTIPTNTHIHPLGPKKSRKILGREENLFWYQNPELPRPVPKEREFNLLCSNGCWLTGHGLTFSQAFPKTPFDEIERFRVSGNHPDRWYFTAAHPDFDRNDPAIHPVKGEKLLGYRFLLYYSDTLFSKHEEE